jgi:hypothetical protein
MAKTPYTPRFKAREAELQDANELRLKFVRALANADAHRDSAKVLKCDWRMKPKKQVFIPSEERRQSRPSGGIVNGFSYSRVI